MIFFLSFRIIWLCKYSNSKVVAKEDKNFVSTCSKEFIELKERYSEDFAESVSFYFINKKSFEIKYPARADYIKRLLEN